MAKDSHSNSLSVVHLNKDNKVNPAEELAKVLVAKWERRDRERVEKKYGAKFLTDEFIIH